MTDASKGEDSMSEQVRAELTVRERFAGIEVFLQENGSLVRVCRRTRDHRPQYAHHYFDLSCWKPTAGEAWEDAELQTRPTPARIEPLPTKMSGMEDGHGEVIVRAEPEVCACGADGLCKFHGDLQRNRPAQPTEVGESAERDPVQRSSAYDPIDTNGQIQGTVYAHNAYIVAASPVPVQPTDFGESAEEKPMSGFYRATEWNQMRMRSDLKCCPFCGCEACEDKRGNKELQWRIRCSNPHCAVQPATPSQYEHEEAVIDWQLRREERNTRPAPAAAPATCPHGWHAWQHCSECSPLEKNVAAPQGGTPALVFSAKLMRDIENGVPFGKGESGC